ncbi:MAG: cytochrome C [Campylobacterota bacterium]|nr:cytochrome C [Campylobacterota bacterium]
MNKPILFFVMMTVLTLAISEAAVYKGQRTFKKECVACHSNGQTFVVKYDTEYWENLMKNEGQSLREIHLKSQDAQDSKDYFNSKKYDRKVKHLKDFLIEYAKDSGNVPACN